MANTLNAFRSGGCWFNRLVRLCVISCVRKLPNNLMAYQVSDCAGKRLRSEEHERQRVVRSAEKKNAHKNSLTARSAHSMGPLREQSPTRKDKLGCRLQSISTSIEGSLPENTASWQTRFCAAGRRANGKSLRQSARHDGRTFAMLCSI